METNMKSENEEVFRPIAGYEDLYLISNLGRVQSLPRWIVRGTKMVQLDGRILKGGSHPKGYRIVCLSRDGVSWAGTVHRLVAKAFIENPENKPEVNHKNGIKTDNRIENLEWATISENRQHAYDTGLQAGPKGEVNGSSKLSNDEVRYVFRNPDGLTTRELATKLKISTRVIYGIQKREYWKHITKDLK